MMRGADGEGRHSRETAGTLLGSLALASSVSLSCAPVMIDHFPDEGGHRVQHVQGLTRGSMHPMSMSCCVDIRYRLIGAKGCACTVLRGTGSGTGPGDRPNIESFILYLRVFSERILSYTYRILRSMFS